MKKKVIRIFAVVMMICISLLFVGCGNIDNSDDDFDWGGSGNGSQTEATNNLYGTKVLYRPDNYDYDEGSGAKPGTTNNYYGQYSHAIMNALSTLYGITTDNNISTYLNDNSYLISEKDESNQYKYLNYLFDSIRYQVNTVGTVTHFKKQGETQTNPISEKKNVISTSTNTHPYMVVLANTNNHWNWSFDYRYNNGVFDLQAPIKNEINNDLVYLNTPRDTELESDVLLTTINDAIKNSNAYKSIEIDNIEISKFLLKYIGTSSASNENDYSDFVKALEYVIYSYALDLEPQVVSVDRNAKDAPTPYTVKIGAYATVDAALNDIKALFKKMGSFVGLTNRQITKIANWIKANVIGDKVSDDRFYDYTSGGIIEIIDEQDNIVGFEFFSNENTVQGELGRDYSNTVDKIVKNVCKDVPIGEESDGSKVPVDDRFLASEIMEYSKNMFEIIDDNNFPIGSSATDENVLRPLEYQSAVLMLNKPMGIMEVDVAIKYDADLDGTEEGVYNMDKYIDIIVELNYYNHDADKMFVVDSKKMRVYDGPYSMTFEGVEADLPEFHGTAMLSVSNIAEEGKDLLVSQEIAGVQGQLLPVKAFNPDVGNGILKTDVGINGYGDDPKVSQKPLVLTGTTDVRKYYNIVEPTDQELGNDADRFTYITGRLNPKKFSGSDGSDYLEITYKVLKEKGNTTKNYKFYTGVVAIWDADLKQ